MRRALGLCIVCACLAACSPEPQEAPSRAAREAVPEGRWIVAGGAGETALVFVPFGGGEEIALICAMGETPTFRVETGDEAFAAEHAVPVRSDFAEFVRVDLGLA